MTVLQEPFPWLGLIFWLGVFTWLGIKVWSRYRIEQERQLTLRAIAERGTPLDKEMMERLNPAWAASGSWKPTPEGAARGLAVAGIVFLFLGVGLFIGAQFIGRMEPDALLGMSAGGGIVSCLGLGLITSSWVVRRMLAHGNGSSPATGEDNR